MSIVVPDGDARPALREMSRALKELHRLLLEVERRIYERSFGRVASPFYLLKLAAEDPQFVWLKPLSEEVLRLDDLAGAKEPVPMAERVEASARVRALLFPDGRQTSFQQHYDDALQANPEVAFAQGALLRTLAPVAKRRDPES